MTKQKLLSRKTFYKIIQYISIKLKKIQSHPQKNQYLKIIFNGKQILLALLKFHVFYIILFGFT